jgi:hypothetical protein
MVHFRIWFRFAGIPLGAPKHTNTNRDSHTRTQTETLPSTEARKQADGNQLVQTHKHERESTNANQSVGRKGERWGEEDILERPFRSPPEMRAAGEASDRSAATPFWRRDKPLNHGYARTHWASGICR